MIFSTHPISPVSSSPIGQSSKSISISVVLVCNAFSNSDAPVGLMSLYGTKIFVSVEFVFNYIG